MRAMLFASDNSKASGAFKCLAELSHELIQNFKVELEVILPYKGNGTELLEEYQIPYKLIRSFNWIISLDKFSKLPEHAIWQVKYTLNKKAIRQIQNEISTFHPDLVHINTTWSYVGAQAAKQQNIPIVWHIREFLEEDQKVRMWNRKKGYQLMSASDRAIAISKAIYEKYSKKLDCKINIIYDGVEESTYYSQHIAFTHNKLSLLTVGGLYPGKGHDIVIQALAILRKNGYDHFSYNIVGVGPEENRLNKLITELGLQEYIQLCGFSNNTETYYQNNDLFIMPSTSEAFGRVTAEAMLNGMYVIGNNRGATAEILRNGEYGSLFSDANSLAGVLMNIFDNKIPVEEIAARAQNFAKENFTSSVNTKNIYSLYKEVLGNEV